MTTFVDNTTVIQAVWLNSVDQAVTNAIGNGSNPPTTPAQVKTNIGLDQVNNTTDLDKPISTATQTALNTKISSTSTDILTNKTISFTNNNVTTTVAELNTAISDGNILTTTGTDTLTNKTIDYATNTLTNVVGLSATQTLSNKTLDSTCNISSSSGQPFSFRNLLINADFRINQRAYVSGTNTSGSNQYTLDRWRIPVSGKNITFASYLNGNTVTIPASNSIEQVIEGANISGGTYVVNWEGTATCEVNGVSVAKGGTFTLPANTNATIEFIVGTVSRAQVEAGSIATSFENRPIGTELALCQRYFFRLASSGAAWSGYTTSGYSMFMDISLPVTMRTTPILSNVTTAGNYAFGTTTCSAANQNIVRLTATAVSTQPNGTFNAGFDASAEL